MIWKAAVVGGAAILAGCGPRLACGPGTEQEGDLCVLAEAPLQCGPDTIEEEGACIIADPLQCGPGTVVGEGGDCVVDYREACGGGTVLIGNTCVATELTPVGTPFEAGLEVRISQGNHGNFSHNGYAGYAVDYPVPEGTTIVAARAGIVARIKEDSDRGCGEAACADDGNFVVVDHGDGTTGLYLHLEQNGALVDVGDAVRRGDPIARSGNTGWSTGPHLHLEVENLFGHSLPLFIEELADVSGGVPYHGARYTSANSPSGAPPTVPFSDCPADLYQFAGVALDEGLPCVRAEKDVDYPLEGWVAEGDRLAVWQYSFVEQRWRAGCVVTEPDGSFATTLSWPSEDHTTGGFQMLGVADASCNILASWSSSPFVALE